MEEKRYPVTLVVDADNERYWLDGHASHEEVQSSFGSDAVGRHLWAGESEA